MVSYNPLAVLMRGRVKTLGVLETARGAENLYGQFVKLLRHPPRSLLN